MIKLPSPLIFPRIFRQYIFFAAYQRRNSGCSEKEALRPHSTAKDATRGPGELRLREWGGHSAVKFASGEAEISDG